MYALLVLYLCFAVVWFTYTKFCTNESYEAAIFIGVFYPVIILLLYFALTVHLIAIPVGEIITKFIKRKETNKIDN